MDNHTITNIVWGVAFAALGARSIWLGRQLAEYKARDMLTYNLKLQWDKMQRGEQSAAAFLAWLWPYMEGGGR